VAGNSQSPGVSVTSRLLRIVTAFDDTHRALTLTALAARADLTLPTAHRLLRELVAAGAVDRDDNGRYVVGRLLWEIGLLAPAQGHLTAVADPFLSDVYAATLATVHLAVRDGTNVLYLQRVAGRASVPIVSTVGTRLPMHCTGVGKVLLAYAPSSLRAEVFADLARMTPRTITSVAVLQDQLSRIRREGVGTTAEEMSLGACSMAVPVMQASDGSVAAAIGVVVPTLKRDRQRLLGALQVAAHGIGRLL
jgi:DNA-binding IclR family transcriptional regulator